MTGLPETTENMNWWFWRCWTSVNKEQWSLRHNTWDKLYGYPILLPWESFQPQCREKKHRQIPAESLHWEDRLESREIQAATIHRTQSWRRESHTEKERQRSMEGPLQAFNRGLRHTYMWRSYMSQGTNRLTGSEEIVTEAHTWSGVMFVLQSDWTTS